MTFHHNGTGETVSTVEIWHTQKHIMEPWGQSTAVILKDQTIIESW